MEQKNQIMEDAKKLALESMNMRDFFASQALPGIVQNTGYATPKACKSAAECAYSVADAMISARAA